MKKMIFICVAAVLCFAACHQKPSEQLLNDGNAVYYWKTSLEINEKEEAFIKQHNIKTIYVRFFDVVINNDDNFIDKCAPSATISFYFSRESSQYKLLQTMNVVPVVFITTDAIKEYDSFTDDLAHRIYAMCMRNGLIISEVQFDCDWTQSTHDAYFQFLKDVRQPLKQYFEKDIKVSSTIRLHQLGQTPPEVDYGVLMCYNTGNFKDFNTQNSILDIKDVKPYMQYLDSYQLPLRLALPAYSWGVEFDKNKQFVELNRYNGYNITDTTKFKHLDNNIYELKESFYESPTHYLRFEQVPAKTIVDAKNLVEKHGGKMSVVLYHLASEELSKYSDDEIKSFFN